MSDTVIQRLEKKFNRTLDKAISYYTILSALNNMNLQRREIELLAFTAIRGTITPVSARKDFVKIFNSSRATIENVKSRLIKKDLLRKTGDMYRINPSLNVDFSRNVLVEIKLNVQN